MAQTAEVLRNDAGATSPARPRVLIAHAQEPVRVALSAALTAGGMSLVAGVADATTAVSAALRLRPDLCLLAVPLPGGGGIAAARTIGESLPGTAVVMLAENRSVDDFFEALRAGATGFLLPDVNPDRLAPAMLGVLRGEPALPRELVAHLVAGFRRRPARRVRGQHGRLVELTMREYEVVELLANGSTAEVAARLGVSAVTVRTHAAAAMRKLGVTSRVSALALIRRGQAR